MPANNPRPASQVPASPRNTAKYTNKDGSKFITVPKSGAAESSQPSTPTAGKPSAPQSDPDPSSGPTPSVNRKKQKRRQKAAAKAAAAIELAAFEDHAGLEARFKTGRIEYEIVASDDEHEYVLADELPPPKLNGHAAPESKGKKNKKKKKKTSAFASTSASPQTTSSQLQAQPTQGTGRGSGMSRDKIWSTSNQEERERIKEFWLGLGEDERKSLVKVEKDAVLKKMKEQQKHTCSCTVCGRKRTAIEEELEGLYDAYYVELEQFANQGEGPPLLPPRDFSLRPPRGQYSGQPPSRGRIVEHVGDDEDEDDLEYSDDEVDDDEYSDDEPPEDFNNPSERDMADFLTFGNSLQVKGGILTVADDLLKNDGRRFIEMMEQLAERRMAREEDAREHFARGYGHPNGAYSTPHHPPPDEDDFDDEDEEEDEYDSQEEYEDEEDPMTEEQRMEEGRRMFQIFAARMFEQRVLSAYKEKVAKERQQKLLEELEEESRQVDQQKARKAKNAQKKKDKAAQKKQALAEEKARKEAEKAAEEAARLQAEKQRVAEQKRRAEEKRKQKEAQRKAEEEARLRKEAERQRRLHEQREKQAEQERRARESKEREKRLREEQRLRERDAREQKEREAQERKEKQERDKREKEARAAKALREAQEAKEAKERLKEEKKMANQASSSQPPKRAGQQHPVSIPTALPQHPPNPANYASPKIPVATPVIPKAPTPIRPRTTSQQHDGQLSSSSSQPASIGSQNPSPHAMTPVMSPGIIGQQRKGSAGVATNGPQQSQSDSPQSGAPKLPTPATPFQIPPPIGMQPPPGLPQHPPPGFPNPLFPPGFRSGPNMMMPPPPGITGPPAGRGFPPMPMAPPGFAQPAGDQFGIGQGFQMPKDGAPPTHTRQGSTGFDGSSIPSTQPIGRPAPIGRPGSVNHGRSYDDKEDETTHLGSRALLEDDEPLASDINTTGSLRNQPPGPRGGFPASPFMDATYPMSHSHNVWGPPAAGAHQFPPPGFGNPGWGAPAAPPGFGMGSPSPVMSSIRGPVQPRHVAVRLLLCQACKDLASGGDAEGYVNLATIKSHIEAQTGDQSISEADLLNLCDTEGSLSNGGGTFDVKRDVGGPDNHAVRWQPDQSDAFNPSYRAVGAPGEIGSPLTGNATLRGI